MADDIDLLDILQQAHSFCVVLRQTQNREEVQLPEDLALELPRLEDRIVDGIQYLLRQRDDRGLSG